MRQNCRHCIYAYYEGFSWDSNLLYVECRRYPEPLDKDAGYLCGEHKPSEYAFDFKQEMQKDFEWNMRPPLEDKVEVQRLKKLLNKRNKQIKELKK
jgi:hypothetical protein